MKKITIAMLALAVLPFTTMAQEDKKEKPEKIEKKEKADKKETNEIIIRQDGDKQIKLKVEIDGDNITVNGKPLSEFKEENVTINKRKMTITDGDNMMSFNFNGDGNDWEKWGQNFGKNFEEQFKFNENNDGAFLGVTTETEGDGVKIVDVSKGSAAEKSGLKKGDIITKIGDDKIGSPDELSDLIAFKKPQDEVKVTYKRNGKESTVKAILGKRKAGGNAFGGPNVHSYSMPKIHVEPFTNMEGFNGDDDMPDIYAPDGNGFNIFPKQKKIGLKIQDIEEGNGVKVINVEDSSAAAIAGIKKDDIITEINGKKIDNTDDAREELVPDEDKKLYKIKINRGSSEMNFDVKIPRKLKTANL